MRQLHDEVERLNKNINSCRLFPSPPFVSFRPEVTICPTCNKVLNVFKTRQRLLCSNEIGEFYANETILRCESCKQLFFSEKLSELAPCRSKFSYGVIIYVGYELFVHHRCEKEVARRLRELNVRMSRSEIRYLGRKFITYLAEAHKEGGQQLRGLIVEHGGYVLHLDATCEGDSPQLMSVVDEVSGLVLGNVKLPSEKSEQIIPFLKEIRIDYGAPLAIVRDMGAGIASATQEVFPDIPSYICHFHFLRDIGKDLFGAEYELLHKGLKHHLVRNLLRKLLKSTKRKIDKDIELTEKLKSYMNDNREGVPIEQLPCLVIVYIFTLWILNSKTESNGYGFPFDQPHLYFYQRAEVVQETIKKLKIKKRMKEESAELEKIIRRILLDNGLKKIRIKMEEKIEVFNKLRTALRIASPTGTSSLKDNGEDCDIEIMKKEVNIWQQNIIESEHAKELPYKKVLKQIAKYWNNLFAAPIEVSSKSGRSKIQPQRTNNILETFFRDIKRGYRKKTGNHSLSNTLKTMLAQTPLIRNLQNAEYLLAILNNKASLAERFAEIDSKTVRKNLDHHHNTIERIPIQLVRLLKIKTLPQKIMQANTVR